MDKVTMKGMKFYGYHGVLKEEQQLGQQFEVDLILYLDLKPAGLADNLTITVNYVEVYNLVKKIVEQVKFKLIEALAEAIALRVLDNFSVQKVTVSVRKPQAPIQGVFDYVAVEITRCRSEVDNQ